MIGCRTHKKIFVVALALATMLVFSGCHSSKNTRRVYGGEGVAKPLVQKKYYVEDYAVVGDNMSNALLTEAFEWIGTPYMYGGHEKQVGTDCSGFVMEVFLKVCGVKIPRTTGEQVAYCLARERDDVQPGDLVFLGSAQGGEKVSHVGMYIGKGEMVHASSSRGVTVSRVNAGYWSDKVKGVGRVGKARESYARVHNEKPIMLEKDLLDDLINEKVDSIFSSQFMD